MTDHAVHASPLHPHEPAIPPLYDMEGRCVVCGLLVLRDELDAHIRRELDAHIRRFAALARPVAAPRAPSEALLQELADVEAYRHAATVALHTIARLAQEAWTAQGATLAAAAPPPEPT